MGKGEGTSYVGKWRLAGLQSKVEVYVLEPQKRQLNVGELGNPRKSRDAKRTALEVRAEGLGRKPRMSRDVAIKLN